MPDRCHSAAPVTQVRHSATIEARSRRAAAWVAVLELSPGIADLRKMCSSTLFRGLSRRFELDPRSVALMRAALGVSPRMRPTVVGPSGKPRLVAGTAGLIIVRELVVRADTLDFYVSDHGILNADDTPHGCLFHHIWFY